MASVREVEREFVRCLGSGNDPGGLAVQRVARGHLDRKFGVRGLALLSFDGIVSA